MSCNAPGHAVHAPRWSALAVLTIALVAGPGCAFTGQVAPRTLTVEVSTEPASVLNLNIVIVPLRGGNSPAGDAVFLGTVRARDLASFEFHTDRMGRYRLYATSGRVSVVANEIRISARGRDDETSRTFSIRPDTQRIIWDLATDVLLVR